MYKLGIIGAENVHSRHIATLCNIKKKAPIRVPMIWGERPKFAKDVSERGGIPEIVKDWRDMLGKVDAVMIDHRHPGPHYEAARFFLDNKVPAFVDKPFTWKLREAKALADLARKKRTSVITFSNVAIQEDFLKFKKEVGKNAPVRAINSTGPCDLRSKYGGVFFYGIHQVDAIVELLGPNVKRVSLERSGPNGIATLFFAEGPMATLNCIKEGGGGFHWTACTDKGVLTHQRTENPARHMEALRMLHRWLKAGKAPMSRERMLAPIAVLEALQKSLDRRKPVNVATF